MALMSLKKMKAENLQEFYNYKFYSDNYSYKKKNIFMTEYVFIAEIR